MVATTKDSVGVMADLRRRRIGAADKRASDGGRDGLEIVPNCEQCGPAIQGSRVDGMHVDQGVPVERAAASHPWIPLRMREQGTQATVIRIHPSDWVEEGAPWTSGRDEGKQAAANAHSGGTGESDLVWSALLDSASESKPKRNAVVFKQSGW